MDIVISDRHGDASPEVRAYVYQHLNLLDGMYDGLVAARVVFDKKSERHFVRVQLQRRARTIDGYANDLDIDRAFTRALERVRRVLKWRSPVERRPIWMSWLARQCGRRVSLI